MGKQASNPMPEEHASPPATAKIGPSENPDLPLAPTSNAMHKDVHKYNTGKQAPTPVPDKHAPTEPIRTVFEIAGPALQAQTYTVNL